MSDSGNRVAGSDVMEVVALCKVLMLLVELLVLIEGEVPRERGGSWGAPTVPVGPAPPVPGPVIPLRAALKDRSAPESGAGVISDVLMFSRRRAKDHDPDFRGAGFLSWNSDSTCLWTSTKSTRFFLGFLGFSLDDDESSNRVEDTDDDDDFVGMIFFLSTPAPFRAEPALVDFLLENHDANFSSSLCMVDLGLLLVWLREEGAADVGVDEDNFLAGVLEGDEWAEKPSEAMSRAAEGPLSPI